eukprot:6078925-Pleurochrysis_carterae.AAC.1
MTGREARRIGVRMGKGHQLRLFQGHVREALVYVRAGVRSHGCRFSCATVHFPVRQVCGGTQPKHWQKEKAADFGNVSRHTRATAPLT